MRIKNLIKNSGHKLQVCVTLLLPPGIKGLMNTFRWDFKIYDTTSRKNSVNKVNWIGRHASFED